MLGQTTTFRLPPDQVRRIDGLARRFGTSRNHVVTQAIAQYLEQNDADAQLADVQAQARRVAQAEDAAEFDQFWAADFGSWK